MLKEILLLGIGKMGFPTFQSISFVNQIMETDNEYLENWNIVDCNHGNLRWVFSKLKYCWLQVNRIYNFFRFEKF